jgi:polar amino acid transport system substrate-binding protein
LGGREKESIMKRTRTIAFALGCFLFAVEAASHELSFATGSFPPFTYAAADGAAGPLAEVIRAVCRRIRTSCSIEVQPWSRAYAMAENGDVDALFALPRNAENEERFLISEMIVASAIGLFAPATSDFRYRQASDLDGYTIGVQGPSLAASVVEAILQAGSSGRVEVDVNNVLVLKKLAGGRYGDAGKGLAAINRDVAFYLMRHEGISGLKQVGELARVAYGVGFSKSNLVQFKAFNRALKALIREGQVKSILRKHGLQAAG